MDLGLYNLKYPFRRLIGGVLPLFENVSPNAISWSLLPVGIATAWCYWEAAQGSSVLYLVGIGLIFLRMFIGTLDGLVATHFKKSSESGEMVNRLVPEICDVLYLLALTLARPEWLLPGVLALAIAWLTTFAGLIGLAAGRPIQSVGPVGQTDRIAALQVFSLLAFLGDRWNWNVDFMGLFLWWVVLGGSVTVLLRLSRQFGERERSAR